MRHMNISKLLLADICRYGDACFFDAGGAITLRLLRYAACFFCYSVLRLRRKGTVVVCALPARRHALLERTMTRARYAALRARRVMRTRVHMRDIADITPPIPSFRGDHSKRAAYVRCRCRERAF